MVKFFLVSFLVLGFQGFVYADFVITFNGVTPGPFNSVVEGDYVVTWGGFGDQTTAVSVGGNIALSDSDPGLTNGLVLGSPIVVARVDGAQFDLLSLDFANKGTSPTGSFAFAPRIYTTGFDDRFPTTNSAFTTFPTIGSRYEGLTSIGIATLSWQGDAYLLDNIHVRVSAVPEPSSMILCLGIAAVVSIRRWRPWMR